MSTAMARSQNSPTDLWDNPMGTFGFEFVEYTAEDPAALGRLFEQMAFRAVARHRSKAVTHYRQGDINFIVNAEPRSFAHIFACARGPSACAIAFRARHAGASCLAEVRMIETLDHGAPKTPFLSFGDTVRIEMLDAAGATLFGAIEQTVVAGGGAVG